MPRTFAVRVAKQEAIRLLAEAMRKKQAQFKDDLATYEKEDKKREEDDAKAFVKWQADIAKIKSPEDLVDKNGYYRVPSLPSRGVVKPQPVLSLCEENQLLTMLRADTRDTIPVPEGSLLWTFIQGHCTPITSLPKKLKLKR